MEQNGRGKPQASKEKSNFAKELAELHVLELRCASAVRACRAFVAAASAPMDRSRFPFAVDPRAVLFQLVF